ncbi:MAG TPA: extracellular solute-binding protein [Ktedonobacteraceae bacterium]|jgi:multiple sugar transport system substrate-binding protein
MALMNKISRRSFLSTSAFTLGAIAAPTLLQACGSASSGNSAQNVTLSFVGYDPGPGVQDVIKGFQKANPTIKIKYEPIPFAQLNDVLQTRLSSGDTNFDVYTADQPRIAALVQRNFLTDLSEKVSNASDVLPKAMIEASSAGTKLYSLPISNSSQLLYYNVDFLHKAGITPPSADPNQRWTWEQLFDAAKKAQAAGARWGLMFEQVSRYYQLQPLFESAGGGSGLTGEKLLTPDVTNPGWIKAATFYGQTFAEKVSARGIPADQVTPLFSNGQLAFFIGGPWQLGTFENTKGLNFGVAAHPYFEGGKAVTPTGSWSWGINPHSPHQEAALKFLEYASLDPIGCAQANSTNGVVGGIPANIKSLDSYFTSSIFQVPSAKGGSDLLKYELQNTAIIRPRTIGYIQFEDIIGTAFEDIRNGSNVEQRLQKASTDLSAAFARL